MYFAFTLNASKVGEFTVGTSFEWKKVSEIEFFGFHKHCTR